MKLNTLAALACIVLTIWASPSVADWTEARCEIYPKGSDRLEKMVPCTFGQRQGYITITRKDGVTHDLSPVSDAPGNFARPKHVAVDDDGTVYVVDAAFQNVQMFNDRGDLLMFFGSGGFHEGAMSLPAGIAVADGELELLEPYVHPAFEAERFVLVTNQFGLHKVAVYALGRLKQGRTIDDIAPYAAPVDAGLGGGQVVVDPAPPQDAPPDAEAASLEAEP